MDTRKGGWRLQSCAVFCGPPVPIPWRELRLTTGVGSDHSLGPLAARGPAEAKGLIQAGRGVGPGLPLGFVHADAWPVLAPLTPAGRGEDAVHLDREHQAGEEEAVQLHHEEEEERDCRRTGSAGPTRRARRRAGPARRA